MPADVHLSRVLLCCARICVIMARGWHDAWGLAAALLLLALQPCAACSDVLVACGRYAQAPASARTFDWRVAGAPSRRHHSWILPPAGAARAPCSLVPTPSTLASCPTAPHACSPVCRTSSSNINYSVNLSPPGHQYTAGVVATGVPARTFTWKHGFAGLNILNSALVVDGLNDAGLSAAYLWQESAMLISNYTADGPEFALAADDLLAYILGTFSDVDEAVEFMSSGAFQVCFVGGACLGCGYLERQQWILRLRDLQCSPCQHPASQPHTRFTLPHLIQPWCRRRRAIPLLVQLVTGVPGSAVGAMLAGEGGECLHHTLRANQSAPAAGQPHASASPSGSPCRCRCRRPPCSAVVPLQSPQMSSPCTSHCVTLEATRSWCSLGAMWRCGSLPAHCLPSYGAHHCVAVPQR